MSAASPAKNITATHAHRFGTKTVTPDQKTAGVRAVFNRVAGKYDVMNDAMSLGLHRIWKRLFVHDVAPRLGEHILDVAGGTGDISRLMYTATRGQAQITVCDPSLEMMKVGRARNHARGITAIDWVEGTAEMLPFPDASFDAYTISFGLRNVTDLAAALKEARRVLKPGGRFFCMEFTQVETPWLASIYKAYNRYALPALGQLLAKDTDSYQYLAESIAGFPDAPALNQLIQDAGFENVHYHFLSGGIVAIHRGMR